MRDDDLVVTEPALSKSSPGTNSSPGSGSGTAPGPASSPELGSGSNPGSSTALSTGSGTGTGTGSGAGAESGSESSSGRFARVARAGLIPMIALCCGVTVANIYLSQPLLTLIADGFGVSDARAGWVATVAQFGYGLGVLLFVPLGDVLRHRPLLLTLLAGTTAALGVAAVAGQLPVLLIAVLLASACTVVSQLLIPLVSQLTPPQQRGRVISGVQLGLFTGIILSRVIGGLVGEHGGWRAAYLVAAAATAVVGLVTVLLLPADRRETGSVSYLGLLGSLPGLLREEPELRRATVLQATVFGTFSMFWTTLVFLLTAPPYGFDAGTAGLFGLFGLVGAFGMPVAGRFIDRFGPLPVAGVGAFTVLVSAICFALGQSGLGFAIAAITLVNVGVFIAMGANQTRVMALRADARSRVNTIFVGVAFVGSSVGAALAATLYGHFGWPGVALTGVGTSTLACVFWADQWRCRTRAQALPIRSDSGR